MPEQTSKVTLGFEGEEVKIAFVRSDESVETYALTEDQQADLAAFLTDLETSLRETPRNDDTPQG